MRALLAAVADSACHTVFLRITGYMLVVFVELHFPHHRTYPVHCPDPLIVDLGRLLMKESQGPRLSRHKLVPTIIRLLEIDLSFRCLRYQIRRQLLLQMLSLCMICVWMQSVRWAREFSVVLNRETISSWRVKCFAWAKGLEASPYTLWVRILLFPCHRTNC